MSTAAGSELVHGRVSIVIPVHNGMPHVKQAIESALDQDYGDLEIVVVENMSDDGTKEYLGLLDDARVRIVEQPELVPVDQNFTRAVAEASGEFVRILCSDDLLKPGAVSAHVRGFRENPGAVLVSSTRDICDERGKTMIKGRGLDGLDIVNARSEVISACVEYGTNVIGEPFCRTNALQAELPFSLELEYVLDLELYVRALNHGTLVTVSGTHSVYRIRLTSYSAEVSNTQADDFTEWVRRLGADPALEINEEVVEHAQKRARKNQRARTLVYRYLGFRERVRNNRLLRSWK